MKIKLKALLVNMNFKKLLGFVLMTLPISIIVIIGVIDLGFIKAFISIIIAIGTYSIIYLGVKLFWD